MACFGGIIHSKFGYDILSVTINGMLAYLQSVCNPLEWDDDIMRKKVSSCRQRFFQSSR